MVPENQLKIVYDFRYLLEIIANILISFGGSIKPGRYFLRLIAKHRENFIAIKSRGN